LREGYRVEVKVNEHRTVVSAWVRFSGLPHEFGLTPHASQTLSIKVELDKNPPQEPASRLPLSAGT